MRETFFQLTALDPQDKRRLLGHLHRLRVGKLPIGAATDLSHQLHREVCQSKSLTLEETS